MLNKVLVAYATKYGATQEIAEKINAVLKEHGLDPDLRDVESVDGLDEYQGVILGSAVYVGQWRKEASTFLQDNQGALAERPVWLFSSGPTGEGEPVQLMGGWRFPETLQPTADRIAPRDIALFHDELGLDKLNLPEKLIVKALKAPADDSRDWDEITAWAETIAETLQQEKA